MDEAMYDDGGAAYAAEAYDSMQAQQQGDDGFAGGAGGGYGADPLSAPPYGAEIFIGGIPREAGDAALRAFCAQAGEIYQLRMPRDQADPTRHKGFAFCEYTSREAAAHAATSLNGTELREAPGAGRGRARGRVVDDYRTIAAIRAFCHALLRLAKCAVSGCGRCRPAPLFWRPVLPPASISGILARHHTVLHRPRRPVLPSCHHHTTVLHGVVTLHHTSIPS